MGVTEKSIIRRAAVKAFIFFAAGLLNWFLGYDIGMRWFIIFGVGTFCREIYPIFYEAKAISRLVAAFYVTAATIYVLIELLLQNYFWGFLGVGLHGFFAWSMLNGKPHSSGSG